MAVHYFDPNGIDSLRDNGYRDTSMALAELIDNSIQANANKVEIFLIERAVTGERTEYLVNEIVVIDNGEGMNRKTLETSLRFGGGTRHGAKRGLGKFGMGLPNSSASQCPRFEVYSWQKPGSVLYNYFDFKEIRKKSSEYLPEVEEANIPKYLSDQINPFFRSGTIVRWVNCDRLILRRSNKLVQHIEEPLGRIFRYFIHEQTIEIKIRVFQNIGKQYSENFSLSKIIKPMDPLFLMTDTQLADPYGDKATSQKWGDGEYIFPDPKGDADNKKLHAQIGDSIKIKFSHATLKTRIEGGASKLGGYYEKYKGISVVRANREIKLDHFGFITSVSDTRNRWWKVEINFEASFDSFFGVDNTKQNVHAFKNIKNKSENAGEESIEFEFMAQLSKFIDTNLSQIKNKINEMKDDGGDIDGTTDKEKGRGPFVPLPLPESTSAESEDDEEVLDSEKEELRKWLLLRYPEYGEEKQKLKLAIEWFFSNKSNQVVVFVQLGAAEFYNYKVIGHHTIIEINTQHYFYLEFIKPIFDENDKDKISPLLLLFGAMVDAEKHLISYQQYITQFRSEFAVKLSQFILYWRDNK